MAAPARPRGLPEPRAARVLQRPHRHLPELVLRHVLHDGRALGQHRHLRALLGPREPHHVGEGGEALLPALRPRRQRRAHLQRGLRPLCLGPAESSAPRRRQVGLQHQAAGGGHHRLGRCHHAGPPPRGDEDPLGPGVHRQGGLEEGQVQDDDGAAGVGQVPRVVAAHPRHGDARDRLRHVHQHRGGDVEGAPEGAVRGPQRLLHVHGHLLLGNGDGHHHRDALLPLHLREVRMGHRRQDHAGDDPGHGLHLLLAGAGAGTLGARRLGHRLHASDAERHRRGRAEHPLEVLQVRALRPLQGDGLHPARPGAEEQGQGGHRRHREPPGEVGRLFPAAVPDHLTRLPRGVGAVPGWLRDAHRPGLAAGGLVPQQAHGEGGDGGQRRLRLRTSLRLKL
mmetsp:Transcript_34332/g.74915  ORF Transcript_34332/g.74915 Transcript_34332/m.74915 type:complete len:395 (+) Transcript_34332:287-1471(+)